MPQASPRRLVALDGLRLVAAVAVAVYHYTTFWHLDGEHEPVYFLPHAAKVTVYGFLGVELFFMISGFAICMSGWGRGLGDFVVSRVSRLYPAYWVCIVLTVTVTAVFPIGGHLPVFTDHTLADVAVNFTMLQEPLGVHGVESVYWTLWSELRFYLLFAVFVVAPGITYRRTVIFCAAWMLAAAVAPAIGNKAFTMLTVRHYAPYFVAGIVLYLMRRFGTTPLLWAMLGLTWLLSLYSLGERVRLDPGWKVALWPAVLIVTACYGVLLLIALGRTDRLSWRWLTVAGALTFPFYLLHQRIGYIVIRYGYEHTGLSVGLLVAGTLAVMLVPAWLVHRCVERPFGPRMRDALRRGVEAVRAATPRPAAARPRGVVPRRRDLALAELTAWTGPREPVAPKR
ncbi:acyltransferase family protein [Couchioplanes caeruleus subsp. azureus]|uniref:acyltransferase family protein n=1 Tax=Couchioplanes caeruleus TaxID=56438 RepID=UPI00361E9CA0